MLRLHDALGNVVPITAYERLCWVHKQDGCDKLSFAIKTQDEAYKVLAEECQIDYGYNEWIVKKIQDGKVECEVNFDFLKSRLHRTYRSETKTLSQVLEYHLPAGWSIENGNVVSIRRTIEFDCCTDYDVVYRCMSVYKVYFVWKLREKTVVVYAQEANNKSGEYLIDELNLKKISYQGESVNYITRLYCYGQDGMTFEDINDGKPYVENHTYTDKIICGYWEDGRYTVKESLLSDGRDKLAQLAYPARSYECKAVNLARLSAEYSFLVFALHKKIYLIDRERGIKIEHQIVEYKEYPNAPEDDVVTLASVPGIIQTSIKNVQAELGEKIEYTEKTLNSEVEKSTQMLVNALGGHVLKRHGELLIMDDENPSTATKVWRWNIEGLGYSGTGIDGPYALAIRSDGTIVADFIMAGTLRGALLEAGSVSAEAISQTFKTEINNEITGAKTEVEQAFVAANAQLLSIISSLTTSMNGEFATTEEAISQMRQTMNDITLSFSERYTGGINLVKNSSGLNGVSDDWDYTGAVTTHQSEEASTNTLSGSAFRLSAATLKQEVTVIEGASYTITLKSKRTSSARGYLLIDNGGSPYYVFDGMETEGWTEHAYTFVAAGNKATITAYTSGSYMFIADLMLTEGNTRARWTPAPNEIYTANVKLDRRGINITNTESATETIIDHTQFAVKHRGETVLTVNKDLTTLRKTEITDELTIGKGKFVPHPDGLNFVLLD